jgi:methylated-DNA-[protein]-cysteine S-methyltransferase
MGHHRRDLQEPLNWVQLPIPTAEGQFLAVYSDSGLAALHFPGQESSLARSGSVQVRRWHSLTEGVVREILAGRTPQLFPPLDIAAHSAFQQAVWTEMRKLRRSETVSYGELARRLGIPRGARAVGNACGANPIPLLIPCHRVLASGGRLGGFSGGLAWKRKLLQQEGVVAIERSGSPRTRPDSMLLEF